MELVSAFYAKTHLSELLKKTQKGEVFVITHRGKPIAKIVPFSEESEIDPKEALSILKKIRSGITSKVNIKEYIDEGRKW
ncbi:type II toxin-antitoxin system prevent-host-death family antitoxin [Leptospira langatensis]|uniref:Antitoxin n=1 Tax=Leptospira langatensis TaxID=2484983 RepID=A0A5F1ZP23_9LEPT|nr:type II toxin-antitoxin system prevent-host-death family antitoxin [Leptospira langatensis]TGL38764.1 type II toxin-antitoxin system prevent-host-death family antitoxin [Leptospira langatensis]